MDVDGIRSLIARAACIGCDENPDYVGDYVEDAGGYNLRWQDYLPVADAVLDALKNIGVYPEDMIRLARDVAEAKEWRQQYDAATVTTR